MADDLQTPALSLQVVYDDPPDLIQVEARVAFGGWSGVTWAYTGPSSLAEEARGLLAWVARPDGAFTLDAGSEGIGSFALTWHATDRAGHLACRVQLAAPIAGSGPESDWHLSLEFPAEASSVERFARQLATLAETSCGEAVLHRA